MAEYLQKLKASTYTYWYLCITSQKNHNSQNWVWSFKSLPFLQRSSVRPEVSNISSWVNIHPQEKYVMWLKCEKQRTLTWFKHIQSYFHSLFSACVVCIVLVLGCDTQVSRFADSQESFSKSGGNRRPWKTHFEININRDEECFHTVMLDTRRQSLEESEDLISKFSIFATRVKFPDLFSSRVTAS